MAGSTAGVKRLCGASSRRIARGGRLLLEFEAAKALAEQFEMGLARLMTKRMWHVDFESVPDDIIRNIWFSRWAFRAGGCVDHP